jgi:uncharacterized protein (TIRG00374 family)
MADRQVPHTWTRRRVLKWAFVLAAVGLEVGILTPELGRAELSDLRWQWIAVAVVAEAASVVALGALYRPLLRAGGLPMGRGRSAALGAAASAITATVPGGPAVASGYLYRQFRRSGGSPALSGWSVGVAGALSVVGFAVVAGTAGALQSADSATAAAGAAAIGVLLALVFIGLAIALVHHARPVLRFLQAACRRLPRGRARQERCKAADLDRALAQFTAIRPGWTHWALALVLAVVTWAADLACFVLSLHAVGIGAISVGAAAAAYGAGLATTSISVLPGGLGTVETGMMIGLTQAGIAGSRAVAGIVTYRLVAYVLVAGIGWLVWAALRRRPDAVGRRATAPVAPPSERSAVPSHAAAAPSP